MSYEYTFLWVCEAIDSWEPPEDDLSSRRGVVEGSNFNERKLISHTAV